ncbi:amidohydrolase [Novosphingobium sp.]|uniref:amidohydrolase n=1 Tax=Novosphingobium sp. TaxID=1874826 RepID=UPI0025FB35D1|nr:amidohydrolase [Novosphingobium sp.]MCC6924749.1 amidohydrolase [Novosphingobium sp.]
MGASKSRLALTTTALLALATSGQAGKPLAPASLWFDGTIITMDGPAPRTVQAVVARDGRIVFAGPLARARKIAGARPELHDLDGATMLPGFVDAHSHFAMAMQVAGGIDLADPALAPKDAASLAEVLKTQVAARGIPPGSWVVAWNYSEQGLPGKQHITRNDLDAALPGYKVVLVHFTGHGLVANSAALDLAGITDSTQAPSGGVIMRDAAGRPNGVLFENAMMPLAMKIPQPTAAQKLAMLDMAQKYYASEGYTHVQEGATQLPDIAFLTSDAAKARLKLDLAILPFASTLPELLKRTDLNFGAWSGHVKLQGIKFVLDGSPQARTAFFTRDYANGSPQGAHPWHGESNMTQDQFDTAAKQAYDRGWQLFVHANGDAAIDMAIKGFDKLGIKAADNRRPVVIHSQFMRPDHLQAYRRIGVGPSYFSNHTYLFADIHRTNFPASVVDFISPLKSSMRQGLHASNHSDYPVTRLDSMQQLWSSMARTSLTGVVSGPTERLTAYEGLQMLTTGPAWQVFEEGRKGRIRAGLLADFVVLDKNPLTTPLDQIRSIKVKMTVKEGKVVWVRG